MRVLRAVVRVKNDGNAVERSNGADEVSGSDGTADGSLLLLSAVLDALASEEGGTALGAGWVSGDIQRV